MDFPLLIRAVMIDLDGTLLDTAPDLAFAANRMRGELGLPALPQETLRDFVGNGIPRFVKRALTGKRDAEPDEELYRRALPHFESYYLANLTAESRPYPGVIEGLRELRGGGFRLACVTNKAQAFTLPLLRDTGLLGYFDLVVSGDTVLRKKPDPLPLLYACERFGVNPDEMLVIGDSANDTVAARAAGCPVFCVPYGYHAPTPIDKLDCDALISTLSDAARYVRHAP